MVLDPFRIGVGLPFGNPDSTQKPDNQRMPFSRLDRPFDPTIGQKNPPIGTAVQQIPLLKTRKRTDNRNMRNPKDFCQIDDACRSAFFDQLMNRFDVIFGQLIRVLTANPFVTAGGLASFRTLRHNYKKSEQSVLTRRLCSTSYMK